MTCPYLEYRSGDGDRSFAVERAYCGAAERFVQPMRADVCNDRYDLVHDRDCEIFREHAPDDPDVDAGAAGDAAKESTSGGDRA